MTCCKNSLVSSLSSPVCCSLRRITRVFTDMSPGMYSTSELGSCRQQQQQQQQHQQQQVTHRSSQQAGVSSAQRQMPADNN
jgi:hypothetical protein